ncbi:hemicentin-1-like [Cebidichthys violaceus]|uniref:hemicentin-1-like n=1 Tax=Cebidichthys violaceus TaxID=271503 RepID=UPI0035CA9319
MKTIVWFGFVLGALSAAGKVILTNVGQKVTLECGVNTVNNRLVWHHGDDLIHSIPMKSGFPVKGRAKCVERTKVKQTKLEISAVKEEDAGKFICTADGTPHEHILLVVSVGAKPSGELQLGSEAALHCQVKGLNQDPLVWWERPDGSRHSGTLGSVTRSDAGTWECKFSHDGGTYNMGLTIKVQEPAPEAATPSSSQSSNDDLKPACPDCVTHQAPLTPSAAALLLGLSWWVWVAVGVGCLVVVVLMVFVIVLCKRIRRKKRKFQTMKNGRQPLQPKKYCQCDCPAAAAKPQQGRRREKPSAPPL